LTAQLDTQILNRQTEMEAKLVTVVFIKNNSKFLRTTCR